MQLPKLRSFLVTLLFVGPVASGSDTWIVSSTPSRDAHFLSLQEAVDAALPGDVVVVRRGTYADTRIDKGLTLIGEPGTRLGADPGSHSGSGSIVIADLPPGPPAIVVDTLASTVTIRNCQASVLLDNVDVTHWVAVRDCDDVRLRRVGTGSSGPELRIEGARVEVDSCRFFGESGDQYTQLDGDPGIEIAAGSRVHLSRTHSSGGYGADAYWWGEWAGNGGPGIYFEGSSSAATTLIVAGGNVAHVLGGDGGYDYVYGGYYDGFGGDGLLSDGDLALYCQTQFEGGYGYHNGYPISGPAEQLTPPAPTLSLVGTPEAGKTLSFHLTARHGAFATLLQGGTPVVQPEPGILVERLVDSYEHGAVGAVGAGNQLDLDWQVPATAQTGDLFVLQVQLVLPSGKIQRTNSLPVIVR